MKTPCLTALLATAFLAADAAAQEWTRFRGPNGTGISAAKGIPVTWTEKDFRWRVQVPGESHSQPVIWEGKIFVLSAQNQGKEKLLICLNKADGKELWVKKYPMSAKVPGNKNSGYANGSAVVDKDRVIACIVGPDQFLVKAWDHSGKELWTKNLGTFDSQHGHGASPILFENKVIVTNDQDAASSVVALDVKTGQPVWQSPRKPAPQGTAYGTPAIYQKEGGKPELLLTSRNHGISSIDPKTGAPNWEAVVFNLRSVASPVVAGDVVIGSCGQGGGAGNFLAGVKLGGRGDVTSTHVAYKITQATPYVPTPIALGNRFYYVSDGGVASCIDAPTGRVLWSERLGGEYFSSPVCIDGKIYCLSTRGEMSVFEAADQWKLLGKSPVGEGSHSTPAVDGDRLYIKTFTHLVCVGGK